MTLGTSSPRPAPHLAGRVRAGRCHALLVEVSGASSSSQGGGAVLQKIAKNSQNIKFRFLSLKCSLVLTYLYKKKYTYKIVFFREAEKATANEHLEVKAHKKKEGATYASRAFSGFSLP